MLDYFSAKMLLKTGKYQQAVEAFKSSIHKNPGHMISYFSLAIAYEKLKQFDKTEAIYTDIKKISPNNMLGVTDLGIIYFKRGEYKKAIKQFELLAQIAPNNFMAYVNIAAGHYSLGQVDQAIIYTKSALEMQPSADSFSNLGTMYFYKADYIGAVNAYEKMIELNATDYINWGNLADAYKLTNNSKSKYCYQKAVELALLTLNPNDSAVIADLAYYYANIGETENALKSARQIGKNNAGNENFIVATAYSTLYEKDLAFTHLNYAIDKNYSIEEILQTPLLENIKPDRRFLQLEKRKL
ncbi:MAG: tetratricopeptide repeat protein [Alcanivoracaceae bacterium]|nr:tetratricopeptide repeat protein [Alcanivoracaceae bacterium]